MHGNAHSYGLLNLAQVAQARRHAHRTRPISLTAKAAHVLKPLGQRPQSSAFQRCIDIFVLQTMTIHWVADTIIIAVNRRGASPNRSLC